MNRRYMTKEAQTRRARRDVATFISVAALAIGMFPAGLLVAYAGAKSAGNAVNAFDASLVAPCGFIVIACLAVGLIAGGIIVLNQE